MTGPAVWVQSPLMAKIYSLISTWDVVSHFDCEIDCLSRHYARERIMNHAMRNATLSTILNIQVKYMELQWNTLFASMVQRRALVSFLLFPLSHWDCNLHVLCNRFDEDVEL